MMARLTGLPVSNASLYDGATAEAMLMCAAVSREGRLVLVAETVDPKVREVVRAYAHFRGIELRSIPARNGVSDFSRLGELLRGGAAGVIVQQPNYYGIVEDFSGVADACHVAKALLVVNAHASGLAVLKTPGEWGADIAVGEGQSLGIPMAWGGPYLGYMTVAEKHMRKMPGRIVGQTVDRQGRRAFVLTIQARERHIRRQNATSNICSNLSLMALCATIYMSLMGRKGLERFFPEVSPYNGNFLVNLRAMAYIVSLGRENIKQVGPLATLNATYMRQIAREAKETPGVVKGAPRQTPISRVDDVRAALRPILTFDQQ